MNPVQAKRSGNGYKPGYFEGDHMTKLVKKNCFAGHDLGLGLTDGIRVEDKGSRLSELIKTGNAPSWFNGLKNIIFFLHPLYQYGVKGALNIKKLENMLVNHEWILYTIKEIKKIPDFNDHVAIAYINKDTGEVFAYTQV